MEVCNKNLKSFHIISDNLKCKSYGVIKSELCQMLANISSVCLPNEGFPLIVKDLLEVSEDEELLDPFLQVLFECSKVFGNQQTLANETIVECMLKVLKYPTKSLSVHLAAIGTLANICYENESGGNMIGKNGILFTLKMLSETMQNICPSSLTISTSYIGLLLNILNANDGFYKFAIENGLIHILEYFVDMNINDESTELLFKMIVAIFDGILSYGTKNVDIKLFALTVNVLMTTTEQDLATLCIDIISDESDRDDVKLLAAEKGVCEFLVTLINDFRTQPTDADIQMTIEKACQFLIIVLTDDKCMELLFNNGEGVLVQYMIMWLIEEETNLLCTAILAMGNFAREVENCIKLGDKGVAHLLIGLLTKYNQLDGNMNVQYALLSALKILAIPPKNKEKMAEAGLIEIVSPLLETEHEVIFLLLIRTLAFLLDGQETIAYKILYETDILHVIERYTRKSEKTVQMEISHFLSTALKCLHSADVVERIIKCEGIRFLVNTINTDHNAIQTECLWALQIVAMNLEYEEEDGTTVNNWPLLAEKLIDCNFGARIVTCIELYDGNVTNSYAMQCICQILHLLLMHIPSGIATHLKQSNLIDTLRSANERCHNEEYNAIIDRLDGL